MRRMFFLLAAFIFSTVSTAYAEDFSQAQFALLVVVNMALGLVVALFIGVLVSVLLGKMKTDRSVKTPVLERKQRV